MGRRWKRHVGREDPMLAAKEVSLYGGHNREVVKYGFSFNTRSHGEITSS